MGLGINTMEGRDAKHFTLAKFTHNTQFSNRWAEVFKHEYVSLFWLREKGVMKLYTRKQMGCMYQKGVPLHSFAIAGSLNKLLR